VAETFVATAPGRVNLIGEHTDYNGGYVLPTAIPQRTCARVTPRDDRVVRAWSAEAGGPEAYTLGDERGGRGWLDYVQGVTWALAQAGHALGGFDLRLSSDVPLGAGLSSSAALEVALARALRDAFGLALDDVQLALIGQRAENDLVGAPVGVMDQLAASLGAPGVALFVDTRTLETRPIALPPALELLVVSSGISHAHAGGEYRTRRAECELAAASLGVRQLRDLDEADVERAMATLPEPLGRRVRHVVTEDARVLAAVRALEGGRIEELGPLFAASHASMRDDYEVSIPEIDALVAIADHDEDVLGARLTGGGFGGSIVALVHAGMAQIAGARIAAAYHDLTAQHPAVLVPPPRAALAHPTEDACSPS
jgi:galactokinase